MQQVDTLIVGSGVAATAISERLLQSDANASILILEAGSEVKMQDQSLWQDFVVNGQQYDKLPYFKYNDLPYPDRDQPGENLSIGDTTVPLDGSRVMTYGGSTIHWGGWSFRMKPEDFKMKTNTGTGIDWPIAYDEFEPYYSAAENYIGVAGDSNDKTVPRSRAFPFDAYPFTLEDAPLINALTALGWNYSHLPIARHGIANTTAMQAPCKTTGTCKYCPFGARYAATNFLNNMQTWQDAPNFEVRLNAVVQVIDVHSKHQVKGVTYLDKRANKMVSVEAKNVIIAGGAIESPKLLMRSTSEHWPNGVGNDNDLVGRFFITHPYFMYSATVANNSELMRAEMDFPTLCSREFDSEAEQAKGKFVLVNPSSSPTPLVNGKKQTLEQMMQNGMTRAEIDVALQGPAQVQVHGMVEIFSEYNNRVMNLDTVNRIGLPETIVDYSKSADFCERMSYITAKVNQIFAKMKATPSGEPFISWRADHAACTCRMAESADEGVVDSNLKVFGVDNLYVCSNAVFPNTGAINPTLTLTALSIRLGEHLSQPLSKGEAQ